MRVFLSFIERLQKKAVFALIGLGLYLVPGLVQDAHRLGHEPFNSVYHQLNGPQANPATEKCPVCKYEFCSADEIQDVFYAVVLSAHNAIYNINIYNQLTARVFDHLQLRAPPVS